MEVSVNHTCYYNEDVCQSSERRELRMVGAKNDWSLEWLELRMVGAKNGWSLKWLEVRMVGAQNC